MRTSVQFRPFGGHPMAGISSLADIFPNLHVVVPGHMLLPSNITFYTPEALRSRFIPLTRLFDRHKTPFISGQFFHHNCLPVLCGGGLICADWHQHARVIELLAFSDAIRQRALEKYGHVLLSRPVVSVHARYSYERLVI